MTSLCDDLNQVLRGTGIAFVPLSQTREERGMDQPKTSTFIIHHDRCDPRKWTPDNVLALAKFIGSGDVRDAAAQRKMFARESAQGDRLRLCEDLRR